MMEPLILLQQAATDTTSVMMKYADKWEANLQADQASLIIQALASNDLIYVVLTVTLIIWFVLLFYIIKTDRKVNKLEEYLTQQEKKEDET